jgi:hypothetical protein
MMIPSKKNPYASGVQPIGGVPGQSGEYGGINPGGVMPPQPKMPSPPIGGVPGQSGQYGGINPGGVQGEAPIGPRAPQAPIGGIPGQSGKYGGINPGGDNTGPVGQAVPDGSRIGSIPGQSGQYGGINPTPPPNLSGQMIMPDPKTGAVAGYLPSPQTVTGGTSQPNAFSTETLPAPRPPIGGVPGQSGRYGGINPGGGMKQEVIAALKARQRRAPRRQGRAPIGGTPGQSGQYGGINPGGLPRR